ncbi:hypothetical protein P171DRAFT_405593 [Karstenula rhodostoma CBS 690.94]|uniref:Uncharacterized protein n=1 Tax=Karstenula rhodostoma CBS 690.94 TaxID=1392251 RepID=A0A9P4PRH5_9PLEO|nr:hypothetical protein P171DRAFT_405593 [Karstenula rhodostoma CBS 690.94]
MIPCIFFARGRCRKGEACTFLHERMLRADDPPVAAFEALIISPDTQGPRLGPNLSGHPQNSSSDSRATVLCRFVTRLGGCRNAACPYSHNIDKPQTNSPGIPEEELKEDDEEDADIDFTRSLSGAAVHFNEFGNVERISLPADFSTARITGLPPHSTPHMVAEIVHGLQVEIDAECIRIPKQDSRLETMAIVRVEDPLFALKLSDKVRQHMTGLKAISLPTDSKPSNARKVYVSWHRPTRVVWLNFTVGGNLNQVAQRFNNAEYKILGQVVKATVEKASTYGHSGFHKPVIGTVTLSNVPADAKSGDIGRIFRYSDRLTHTEMGAPSYMAKHAEVGVDVRSRLEEHGALESFYMPPTQPKKRVKATALFQEEADARSACSLNNTQIPILGKGKLTVTLVQAVKTKISTTIYTASRSMIDQERKRWQEQYLTLHVYHDPLKQFTTLKVEGNDAKIVADARKTIDKIFGGTLLMNEEEVLWSTALNSNGSVYRQLKDIESELNIAISRDKSKRQLRYHGSLDKLAQTVHRVTDLLKEKPATVHYISLDPVQFSWAIRAGFKNIQQALGEDIAAFDVVSKKITIHGTTQQYDEAMDIIAGKRTNAIFGPREAARWAQNDCPICFCEAENPVSTRCNHTYCLECFEGCCKAAASSSAFAFHVKCQGEEGKCTHIFTLQELRDSLSSSVFETVLHSSFQDHIKQHPNLFHYCPTPDCDYIYRCTTSGADRPSHTCANCLELICTSCHALHGRYACAEYKDIQSGGYEALERLKKELNIKDCPKCTTPMEKTEGCNHMTCGGCKAHICWVCMAVFSTSAQCYDHMTEKHGSIGLGLERFAF